MSDEATADSDPIMSERPIERTAATAKVFDSRLEKQLDLDERRVESYDVEDELATERARQILQDDIEQLYGNDLDIENPPNSIEAFEDRVTLRHLASTAIRFGERSMFSWVPDGVAIDLDDIDVEKTGADNIQEFTEVHDSPSNPANARKAIDRMVEYGKPAEQFLAAVVAADLIHPEISEYALDALSEIRERNRQDTSLVAALKEWWR